MLSPLRVWRESGEESCVRSARPTPDTHWSMRVSWAYRKGAHHACPADAQYHTHLPALDSQWVLCHFPWRTLVASHCSLQSLWLHACDDIENKAEFSPPLCCRSGCGPCLRFTRGRGSWRGWAYSHKSVTSRGLWSPTVRTEVTVSA